MKRNIIAILMLVMTVAAVTAQPGQRTKAEREKWFQELRDWKHKFIIKEVALTDEQQAKFFTIYDAMQNEILAIHEGTRNMEKKLAASKAPSDVEYDKMAETLIEVKIKEGEIQKRYFDKLRTVISAKQIYKLQIAEKKFVRMLNRQHNKHMGEKANKAK